MFICEACLHEKYSNAFILKSLGRCEICKENFGCADIPSLHLNLKKVVDLDSMTIVNGTKLEINHNATSIIGFFYTFGGQHSSCRFSARTFDTCMEKLTEYFESDKSLQWAKVFDTSGKDIPCGHLTRVNELTDIEKLDGAIELILDNGIKSLDSTHLSWVIDQTLRILTGNDYNKVLKEKFHGSIEWEVGEEYEQ